MSNRTGYIFHEDWKSFSPYIYSHYVIHEEPEDLQDFLNNYKKQYPTKNGSGHLYDCEHVALEFIVKKLSNSIPHSRIESLTTKQIERFKETHCWDNALDNGIFFINVSEANFGEIDHC